MMDTVVNAVARQLSKRANGAIQGIASVSD